MTARRPPFSARELRQKSLPRRVLGLQEAAVYCGVGERLFARLVRMGRAPPPRLISTGRSQVQRWDVRELDNFIDRLPSRGDEARASAATPRRLFNF